MLIGIGGYARAGKDAVASVLEAQHGFRRTYMSAPLEQALLVLNPWVMVTSAEARSLTEQSEYGSPFYSGCIEYARLHSKVGYEVSKSVSNVRELLQRLGTEVVRNMIGTDTWIRLAQAKIAELSADGSNVVVTGIRYFNELDMVREAGGISWWIERAGVSAVNGHTSDNTLSASDFEVVLQNNGSLADLAVTVAKLLTGFRVRRAE